MVCYKAFLAADSQGHGSIEADDLVTGIIAEDHDPHSLELNEQHSAVKEVRGKSPQPKGVLFSPQCRIPREPFLPAELGTSVSQEIARPDHDPRTNELPISVQVDHILDVAERLRTEFHHGKIEPLHILAAALREPCEGSRLLKEAGITEDRVMVELKRSGSAAE